MWKQSRNRVDGGGLVSRQWLGPWGRNGGREVEEKMKKLSPTRTGYSMPPDLLNVVLRGDEVAGGLEPSAKLYA